MLLKYYIIYVLKKKERKKEIKSKERNNLIEPYLLINCHKYNKLNKIINNGFKIWQMLLILFYVKVFYSTNEQWTTFLNWKGKPVL